MLPDKSSQSRVAAARFVQGCVLGRAIHAVVGEEGLAAVPSPSTPDTPTYLFWSHPGEAERWADVLATKPRIATIEIHGFLASTLAAISTTRALIGLDWTDEPLEVEITAPDLATMLHEELVRDFAAKACQSRTVWMLHDAKGIASLTSPSNAVITPLWADRHFAEATIAALGRDDLIAMRKPLLELTNGYLLSSAGLKAQLAPGYVHVDNSITMSPWALKALLNGGGRPTTRVANVA